MSRVKDYSLKVPIPAPSRGASGKFQKAPGDRLLEKHRQERAESAERREPKPLRK